MTALLLLFSPLIFSLTHGPSIKQQSQIEAYHAALPPLIPRSSTENRPFAEYEKTGYLLFNDEEYFDSALIKETLARELPESVHLIVYTMNRDKDEWAYIAAKYARWIPADRFDVVYLKGRGLPFWSRDALPYPLVSSKETDGRLAELVNARYYHSYEPDQPLSEKLEIPLSSHRYYFEGGNLVHNAKGDCIVVKNRRVKRIPESLFASHYGCQTVTFLKHLRGIGHADEVVKFVDDQTVLTDDKRFLETLKKAGFETRLLPRGKEKYETYINSLIIEGKVFVPQFGHATDTEALRHYQDLGLAVVPLDSSFLSNFGNGSIHCITMTYPTVDKKSLLSFLNMRSPD